ncbi:MAG: hypothetical protein JXB47_12250 [Anaerolineae bacterium]|nr:hypothetical protein [Anaerolineae bacterium]
MAWTNIPDKNTGDQMDETWYDTHFKANMEYLLNPSHQCILRVNSSNYTTTSTSWVDVDATNLAITLTTYGGPVLVVFSGYGSHSVSNGSIYLDIAVDGSRVSGVAGIMITAAATGELQNLSFAVLVTGLSAASHTIKLQWKVATGTATLFSATGAYATQLSAIEL